MPTVVQFIGGEKPITLEEDYEVVNSQFHGSEAGHFNRVVADNRSRVTIYRSGIAYIEEASEFEGPGVAFG